MPCLRWATGEFDDNPGDDETLLLREYIAPPRQLTYVAPQSKTRRDSPAPTWYLGEHIEPAELATAFGIRQADLPARRGVGAVQPAPGEEANGLLWKLAAGVAIVALLLFVGLSAARPHLTREAVLAWVVPLLAVPQATHYLLDGFIRKRPPNG